VPFDLSAGVKPPVLDLKADSDVYGRIAWGAVAGRQVVHRRLGSAVDVLDLRIQVRKASS
jgi:hypothetical protein